MKKKYSINTANAGAILLEIAFTLPIFLALVQFIILYSVYQNAAATVTSAVFQANRLAVTRANEDFKVLGAVNPFYEGSVNISELDGILFQNTLTPEKYYLTPIGGEDYFLRYDLDELNQFSILGTPRTYLYALVYAYTFIKQGIGGNLKFPCNPRLKGNGGCAQCYFEQPFVPDVVWDEQVGHDGVHFALVCEYRPDSIFLYTLENLGFIDEKSNFGIIRRKATT